MEPGDRKLFAGARVRRLRRELDLTQARMAEELGISASYLNLVERDQRPISAQLLLRLAEVFDVDLKGLSGDDGAGLALALREVFADPLLHGPAGGPPPEAELRDAARASPRVAEALVTLYRAHRATVEASADLVARHSDGVAPPGAASAFSPVEEVRDWINGRGNHFPELEAAAERLWADVLSGAPSVFEGLREHLRQIHQVGLRVLPVDVMPRSLRRFDRHSRRIFLSETLDGPSRAFHLAVQLAFLAEAETLDALVREAGLTREDSAQMARQALANYYAGAVVMPYQSFIKAAEGLRYDIELLAARFGASFEQVCHRLTTLSRPGAKGIPFFMIRLDPAGNISKRFAAAGFPFARFGGTCPRWAIHDAFASPGRILAQIVELPDGARYFTISATVTGPGAGHRQPPPTHALGLGCDLSHAGRLVYGDRLDLGGQPTPIGITCRLCERGDCAHRAHPPLTRRLRLDDLHRGLSPFSFSD